MSQPRQKKYALADLTHSQFRCLNFEAGRLVSGQAKQRIRSIPVSPMQTGSAAGDVLRDEDSRSELEGDFGGCNKQVIPGIIDLSFSGSRKPLTGRPR